MKGGIFFFSTVLGVKRKRKKIRHDFGGVAAGYEGPVSQEDWNDARQCPKKSCGWGGRRARRGREDAPPTLFGGQKSYI